VVTRGKAWIVGDGRAGAACVTSVPGRSISAPAIPR
jgi:hypothetical protein